MSCNSGLPHNNNDEENYHSLMASAYDDYRTKFDKNMNRIYCASLGHCPYAKQPMEGFEHPATQKVAPHVSHQSIHHTTVPRYSHPTGPNPNKVHVDSHSVKNQPKNTPGVHNFRTQYDIDMQNKFCPSCPAQYFYYTKI